MQVIFEIIEKATILDYTTIVIAFASLIVSCISLKNTLNQSKRDKNNRKIDMEANYYSYPILENNNDCEVIAPIDSFCIINGSIHNTNILNMNDHVEQDDNYIQISFKFRNMSKIYPNKVLIKKLSMFYKNEEYFDEKILKEFTNFYSLDNKEKDVSIDGCGYLNFKLNCLMDKKTQNKIINSLEKDNIIQLSFDIYFINVFNVITEGRYNLCLKRDSIAKKGSSRVIGSKRNLYKFKTEIVEYQNKNIYYKENVED